VLFRYSPELTQRMIAYIKQKNGLDISADQANEFLDNSAELCLAFVRPRGGGRMPELAESVVVARGARNTSGTLQSATRS